MGLRSVLCLHLHESDRPDPVADLARRAFQTLTVTTRVGQRIHPALRPVDVHRHADHLFRLEFDWRNLMKYVGALPWRRRKLENESRSQVRKHLPRERRLVAMRLIDDYD